MTLVIARRTAELTWLIADTFTENPGTRERFRSYEQAVSKVTRIQKFAVAYAGSVDQALRAFRTAEQSPDVLAVLTLSSQRNAGSAQAIDFIAIDLHTRELMRIVDGNMLSVTTAYIGSKPAFERYQQHRLNSDPEGEGIQVGLHYKPEPVPAQTEREFTESLAAFQHTLRESDIGAGGFAVPFWVSATRAMFTFYTASVRAPVAPGETTHQGNVNNLFNDAYGGGFHFDFWGGNNGFGAYFERARFGLFYEAGQAALECDKVNEIDPFDFARMAERRAMYGSASRSADAALHKAVERIKAGDVAYARDLLEFARSQAENHLKAMNAGADFSIGDDPFPDFLAKQIVSMTVRVANEIEGYLVVTAMLAEATGDRLLTERASIGLKSWRQVLEQSPMRFGFIQTASSNAVPDEMNEGG